MAVKLMFVHALSSLHAGTGQGVGTIDLPIARERATNLPLVPGSSIKGCLRDEVTDASKRDQIFGTQESAGLLQVADARLLLLPVRCLGASFVWTTSPYVLRRLVRDLEAAGTVLTGYSAPEVADGSAAVSSRDPLVTVNGKSRLVLEDLEFAAEVGAGGEWAKWIGKSLFGESDPWLAEFQKRFAIVDDKNFHFLAEFATEVAAHVKISDKTGTVDREEGALWYQEALPAETVLVSLLRVEERNGGLKPKAVFEELSKTRYLQMGGKATTGQGLVRLAMVEGVV